MTETVYVMEPGSYLRREGGTLKVVKGDTVKAQYLRLSDPGFTLETARGVVRGKLRNMARFLMLRARQHKLDPLRTSVARIKAMEGSIAKSSDLDALRGVEGAGSRVYFEAFPQLIRNPQFHFNGRNRRPPLDPVNGLLSFVYTLLTNEVLSAIKTCGLDPYLGALHDMSYGRPSLACDLVEEYRSFLGDRLVLGLVNRQAVKPDDFIYRDSPPAEFVDEEEMKARRPVEMKPAVSRTFIKAYEEMMKRSIKYPPGNTRVNYRWLILQQVRAFGEYLETPDKAYKPFEWEE